MNGITENLDLFWSAYLRSWSIGLRALVFTMILGTIIAIFRVSPVPPLRILGSLWVTVLRNTPLTVVLLLIVFGVPEVGINAQFVTFGIIGLSLYTSAFVCEALRSGINSVPAGQAEAARALGLTFSQSLTLIILPQALRTVVPPLSSVLIAMFKNSAVVGAVGVGGELLSLAKNLTSAQGYDSLVIFIAITICWLGITLPIAALSSFIEKKVAIVR